MITALRAAVARSLEEGRDEGIVARTWGQISAVKWRAASPAQDVPRVVSVAGSRLGGSLATPLVLALAELALAAGRRVAVVTRVGIGRAAGPVVVRPDTDVCDVGDEALWLARALPGAVVSASTLLDTGVASVAPNADVVIVDGRVAAHVRVLCHDARGPDACPPSGDLRAPFDVLRRWATHVLPVDAGTLSVTVPALPGRVLLATATARPSRVVDAVRALSIVHHVAYPDHGGPAFVHAVAAALERHPADFVVSTEKCASWLPERVSGRPVVVLSGRVRVPPSLADSL